MNPSYDVIIAGAGIIGAACAMECARGGLRTLVLERDKIGGATTSAGMGHIVTMDDSEAQFALTRYSRELWMAMRSQLPPEVEYRQRGTLWVATDDEEMAVVHSKHKFYQQRGAKSQILDSKQVAEAEPNLRSGLAGGLLIPEDAVIYPPAAAKFFLDQAKQFGAELKLGVSVKSFLPEGGVQLADGSRIAARYSVNALGPWSPDLTTGLPVRKRKGHLAITGPISGFVHHQIVELGYIKSAHSMDEDSVAFNIQPRASGELIIGASRQFNSGENDVEQAILNRMVQRAIEFLPGLAKVPIVHTRAGQRAATPDKLPIIGPSTNSERIWLATGHEGLGITTSLGTGRLIADLLLKRPVGISATPYAPARFAK
jgi:glycine/D-amino acid oxidase-like deaminating enzyme